MDPTAEAYERLVRRFTSWAETQDAIRAAIVIGSRARTDHPADEWADLDVIVVADPAPYVSASDWVEEIATPWITFLEPTSDGTSVERRVLFEGGLDVDFAFLPPDVFARMASAPLPPDVASHIRRGIRILLDKDGVAGRLAAAIPEPVPPAPLSGPEFLECVNDFWYHAVWTAKHLRRGELWWAKGSCDIHMKGLLRRMLEWHARAVRGPEHDIWFRGRFLEEWADPRAVRDLRDAFARYDAEDVWRALRVTMDLFRWVAVEAADRLRLPYPGTGDMRATALVDAMFNERSRGPSGNGRTGEAPRPG